MNAFNKSGKYRPIVIVLGILGIILLVTISINIFNQQKNISSTNSEQDQTIIKSTLAIDSITEMIFVFNQDANELHLIKDVDSRWVLVDDPTKSLPQAEIEQMLDLVSGISKNSEIQGPEDPIKLGFDPPVARLTMVFSTGDSELLEIGKVDKDSGQYNIRKNSGKPFLADFQTIYRILKTFYLKVLPVALSGEKDLLLTPFPTP